MPGQVVVTALANFVMGFGLCAFLDIMLRVRRASRFRAEAAARLEAVTPPLSAPSASVSSVPAALLDGLDGGPDGNYGY